MLRVYVLIFPTPTTPSVGGVLGGMEESTSFSSWGKFTFPLKKKKKKKFYCFPYFWQVYFSRYVSSKKISFPTHGIANSRDRKAKEKLNYGPSFLHNAAKKKGKEMCV